MKYFVIILTISLTLTGSETSGQDAMKEGFQNPDRRYSMVPLWSWNGKLEPEQLCWQIDQMVDKGVYGAFMHARAGINTDSTPYFSDGWWTAIETSVDHAKKVGFKAWLYDEDKWPSGSAGGRTVERNPERNVRKGLTWEETQAKGPAEVKINFPGAKWIFAGRLVGEKEIEPESLIDITQFNSSKWQCSEGSWLIIAFNEISHKGGINYLNKDTVRDFMDITHEEYKRRVGKEFGKTIPGVFFDEIHNSKVEIVWVENFLESFQEIKGYDLRPKLPALLMDIGPETPKIRCDYYDVYTSLYENAWFKQLANWCAEHQLDLTGHTEEPLSGYKKQGDYFRTIGHMQIPGTDNEDFRYSYPRIIDSWKPKQLASISHTYGYEKAGVEAMGGAGWSFTLESARYGYNMLASYGINFFMTHLFHYAQDRPKNINDWPNSWFFRNPYWKYFKTFADHSSRLSFMLTGGEHVVDVAILYPQANLWSGHGGAESDDIMEMLVSSQIDADMLHPERLLEADLGNRHISIAAMEYRVLIVPGIQCVRRSAMEKIVTFMESGGKVIFIDRLPESSMEQGRNDPALEKLISKLKNRGINPIALSKTVSRVRSMLSPDIVVAESKKKSPLRYQHVKRNGQEIYWLANGANKDGIWEISFRALGKPSLWQPEDGSITPTSFTRQDNRMVVDVKLDARQGVFVVFDTTDIPPEDSFVAAADPREIGTIPLNELWSFMPAGNQLDYDWRIDIEETELEIPVIKTCWERDNDQTPRTWQQADYDDSRWRQVKIFDALNENQGADRYRSKWKAGFISYYKYNRFKTNIGGQNLKYSKSIMLPAAVKSGHLAVICPNIFSVTIGDSKFEGNGGEAKSLFFNRNTAVASKQEWVKPVMFKLENIPAGKCDIAINAEDAEIVLAEGKLELSNGSTVSIFTDSTWDVSQDNRSQGKAWKYIAPPEDPIGEPEAPFQAPLPTVVWYRAKLPPGTISITAPEIEGDWQSWLNGKPLTFKDGKAKVGSSRNMAQLAIRVATEKGQRALMKPVKILCRSSMQNLESWTRQGLAWYSGRAIYSTTVELNDRHMENDTQLDLDLGEVNWCAEIWINGKLVGTRIWPPYKIDITKHVRKGNNRIDIVVANLIANKMRWDIFDSVKGDKWSRKWHDGNIMRDAWCLESGLIGPVKIKRLSTKH